MTITVARNALAVMATVQKVGMILLIFVGYVIVLGRFMDYSGIMSLQNGKRKQESRLKIR